MAYIFVRVRAPLQLKQTREKARKSWAALDGGGESEKMESTGETEPEFPAFPYKPYSIQLEFMKALYNSLNKGGISMLESPTGLLLSLSEFD